MRLKAVLPQEVDPTRNAESRYELSAVKEDLVMNEMLTHAS